MRQLIVLLVLAFVVTLGVVVATRMSSDAIAVLVGVIAGVAASIPCALLLMAVTRRQEPEIREPEVRESYRDARHAPPPVIIVAPGNAAPQQLPYPASYPYQASPRRGQRQFRVMGYEDEGEQSTEGQAETVSWTQ
jgi:hypothetical protein